MAQAKSKKPLRRRVRRDFEHGDLVAFKTKSFTKNDATEYHPTIDKVTFEFHCTCKDHECRKRVCKHLKRAALGMIKTGELDPAFLHRAGLKCCHKCGDNESLFPVCHDDGSPADGVFICFACVQIARFEAIAERHSSAS